MTTHLVIRFNKTVSYQHCCDEKKVDHYLLTFFDDGPHVLTACDKHNETVWCRVLSEVSDVYVQEKI